MLRRLRRSALGQRLAASRYSPPNWSASLKLARLLWLDYGHLQSVITKSSIDARGEPMPWYTYPAIHYLRQLDVSAKTVFEYGCGHSTLYWSSVAREVVSVEDNRGWFETISRRAPANCRVIFEPDLTAYVDAIRSCGQPFDIIIIDGPARGSTRLKCARAAIRHLRPGGLIVLDNSDWLPESARVLRESGLLQVDMTGFAPISAHTQTTSLFFDRSFDLAPRGTRQPEPGIGARLQDWERRPTGPDPIVSWDGDIFAGITFDERFTVASPAGPRSFRLLVYVSPSAQPTIAILDLDRERVLLSFYQVAEGRNPSRQAAHDEAGRIRQMSWTELQNFVNSSRKQHYLLTG